MKRLIGLLLIVFMSTYTYAQTCGCTDPLANNYNAAATINDGSCTYGNATISATSMGEMDDIISGTSGMIYWNGGYWTYNDHTNTHLYKIDSTNAAIIDSLRIAPSGNYDTEEISQDSLYLYFGDFGNNAGSRTDLHILRISKQGLLDQDFVIDTIFFSYSDQTDFTAAAQETDFDCESFIVGTDSIYVFTKQWVSEGTVCYGFPKEPGTQVATPCGSHNVGGLITGATYFPDKRIVALCGYSSTLQPFLYLLYDFQGENFFSGNKRKLSFSFLTRDQVEAIASSDALHYYITNEYFVYQGVINRPAKFQQIDLTDYLGDYLDRLANPTPEDTLADTTAIDTNTLMINNLLYISISPNPVQTTLQISSSSPLSGSPYNIFDMNGRIVGAGRLENEHIQVSQLPKGQYVIHIQTERGPYRNKFVKW